MSYAELTHADPNPVKRWLQDRRIEKAIGLTPAGAGRVIDYGAGDGEAAARLIGRRPGLEVLCFEPAPELRAEAAARHGGLQLAASEEELPPEWADVVLCLEVLEHLPQEETEAALSAIARVLRPGGLLILGVPQEIGPAALAKGLFRMVRRSGQFDARLGGVLAATFGRPPQGRPTAEIASGRRYHPHHLGFDHRPLVRAVAERFRIRDRTGAPFGRMLPWLNSELYITAAKV